jgi:polar amino acid transport system substrate-binding protein
MIVSRLFCLAVVILLAISGPSSAAEPLSFGLLTAPPYGFELDDTSVSGSNHDIARLIAEKAGLTFTYRLEPLPRLVNDLKAGKLDLMIMFPTAETRPFAITEIMPNSTVILPPSGNTFPQFADLKGKTIGGLRGAVYDQQFAAETEIRKYDVESYRMGLQMTMSGRIDGMIGPDFGLYYQMKLEGMKRDQFGPPMILNTRMLYLLGSHSLTAELATKLRTAVEALRDSGAISAVAAKYLE